MTYSVKTILVLDDNLVYAVIDNDTSSVCIVDVGDASAVLSFLTNKDCSDVLITHHHWDHIDGVCDLKQATGCRVIGNKKDSHRLPKLDFPVISGDKFNVLKNLEVEVIPSCGHTVGHVSYYIKLLSAVFVGDTLFTLGCGRMFEGAYEDYFASIQRLKLLPRDTYIYGGHNYVRNNIAFTKQFFVNDLGFENYSRNILNMIDCNLLSLPITLSNEIKYNPFLKCSTLDEFIYLRKLRDKFRV